MAESLRRFTVDILDRSYTPVHTGRLTLAAQTWEAEAIGGPSVATITGTGSPKALKAAENWLAYHVRIRNANRTVVWWGLITAVQRASRRALRETALDDMRNRLNVDYTYTDNDGASQEGETGWAEHAASVARYGRWEERISKADLDATAATAKRDQWLKAMALPQPMPEAGDNEPGLVLTCSGYWALLRNVYYANALGRLVYDAASTIEHLLGWKLADHDQIAFNRKVGLKIHDLQARLGALVEGTRIDVTGTASNNASYTVTGAANPDLEYHTYTTNNVFFSSADEVYDNLGGFSVFDAGEMIFITGTDDDDDHAENDGLYILQTVEPGNIEVWPSTIQHSSTGQTVTFAQGHSVTVEEPPVNEFPGAATFTLRSRGVRVAQRFQIEGSVAWAVHEAQVRVRKVGAHPDPLQVRLYADSGGSPAATPLATGTLAASEIRTVAEWVTVAFDTPYALQPGTNYWLAVSGTDAGALTCYALGLTDDPDAQYEGGAVKIQRYSDGGWETRWGDAVSMPFQLWGKSPITTQVQAIAAYALPDCTVLVRSASSVVQRFWRDGKTRASDEADDLINTGDGNGNRLAVTVTADRMVFVGVETDPAAADSTLVLHFDEETGDLRRPAGGPVEEGLLPVGQVIWLDDTDAPLTGSATGDGRRMFVERASYDAAEGRLRMEPRGRRAPWDL